MKKIDPDGSKTLYVGGIYEVDKTSGGAVTHTRTYYPAGGAMRVDNTLYYILKDHFGSASAITDSSGASIGTQRYYPFGETRVTTGTINTDKLFTSQREMTGLGIYYYGARFYSQKLGRFLSADTMVPGYANPENLNRFSYTLNNPLKYADPTGHMIDEGCGGGCSYTPPANPESDKPKDDEADDSPGHNYTTAPFPVCWAIFTCSEAEMEDYMTRFQYPGQWPWSPVMDNKNYDVYPAQLWGIPNPVLWILGKGDSGAIKVDISDDDPLIISNRTEPPHIFHNGYVEKSASEHEDGTWYVTTHGEGTNVNPHYGPLIDKANQAVGPVMFELMAVEMMIYVTADQLPGYVTEQTSNLVP